MSIRCPPRRRGGGYRNEASTTFLYAGRQGKKDPGNLPKSGQRCARLQQRLWLAISSSILRQNALD
jgi:hypothetical protein